MKLHHARIWLLAALLFIAPSCSNAVEVAPRISDREIIESLAELKAGLKALAERFGAFQMQIDQRFEAGDQRFEAVDRQLDNVWTLMLVMSPASSA